MYIYICRYIYIYTSFVDGSVHICLKSSRSTLESLGSISIPTRSSERCERERQRLRAEVEALCQKLAVQEEELAAGGGS